MTREEAMQVLNSMLNGIDPLTGEILPEDNVINEPNVIRALGIALQCMNSASVAQKGTLRSSRLWTDEDNQQLENLFQQDVSMEEICAQLQRRERAVRRQLHVLGLITPQPGQEKRGLPWTDEDRRQLALLFAQRAPIADIASVLQRSEYAIFCQMQKQSLFAEEPGYPTEYNLPTKPR